MTPISAATTRTDFGAVKTAIHRKLIQKLNLERLTEANREEVRREVSLILEAIVVGESTPMNLQERERVVQEVLNEVFGLGPLEPLLADPTVSDILVNTYRRVYVERKGMSGADERAVPRRRAPDGHHRSNRIGDWPSRR